jgi:hypothetical protein
MSDNDEIINLQTEKQEMLAHYSRALDEIYRLRQALAYEASVVDAHLGLKSFPASRRRFAEDQVKRMRRAAIGEFFQAYGGERYLENELNRLDGRGLSRARWEAREQ